FATADKLASLRQYLLLNASFRQELQRNSPETLIPATSNGQIMVQKRPLPNVESGLFQSHQAVAALTFGMKISSGSSTSWMIRSSSRVGNSASPFTRQISRSNWQSPLISSGVLPG